jgi:hypothetical protein
MTSQGKIPLYVMGVAARMFRDAVTALRRLRRTGSSICVGAHDAVAQRFVAFTYAFAHAVGSRLAQYLSELTAGHSMSIVIDVRYLNVYPPSTVRLSLFANFLSAKVHARVDCGIIKISKFICKPIRFEIQKWTDSIPTL